MSDYPTAYRRRGGQQYFMDTGGGSGGSQTGTPIREGYRYGGSGYRGGRRFSRPRDPYGDRFRRPPGDRSRRPKPAPAPKPPVAPKPPAAPAVPAREPLLGQYAGIARRGLMLLARRGNPWLSAADLLLQLYMLKQGQPAKEAEVEFFPPSSYVLECRIPGRMDYIQAFGPRICDRGVYTNPYDAPPDANTTYFRASEVNPGWDIPIPNGAIVASWTRIANADAPPVLHPPVPEEAPVYVPMIEVLPQPLTLPQVMPQLDPAAQPPGVMPEVTPMPVPYEVVPHLRPNPNRDPVEQSDRGPLPVPGIPGAPPPAPIVPPVVDGAPEVIVRPIDPRRDFHPPRRREKERKMMLSPSPSSPIMRGISAVTEGMDVTDSWYLALPEDIRNDAFRKNGGFMDPLDKWRAIYENWDKLDDDYFRRAFENMAKDAAEDAAYGKADKYVQDQQRKAGWKGRPVGTGSGPGGLSGWNF